MSRISWERYAIEIAKVVATRSEDLHRKVGAVALRSDNSVASIGYNGAPSGITIDWTDRDERRDKAIHAETNALRYCKPNEIRLLACTHMPCSGCLTNIASYGIKVVIYDQTYETDNTALKNAEKLGIQLYQIDAFEQAVKNVQEYYKPLADLLPNFFKTNE